MKFIIDTQLPPRLARFLNRLENYQIEAIHTTDFEDGHLLADDKIIEIAIQDQRIIISKDSDFLENYLLRGAPPRILLLSLGNIRNQDLLQYFEENFALIHTQFDTGSQLLVCTRTEIIDHTID
ncbi:MAG: DUF5615 family PIN-like protein [Bacteroidota bacterium]